MIYVSRFKIDLWELSTSLFAAQMELYGTLRHQQSKASPGVKEPGGSSVLAPGAVSLHQSLAAMILCL